jgi:hypothetical protein
MEKILQRFRRRRTDHALPGVGKFPVVVSVAAQPQKLKDDFDFAGDRIMWTILHKFT